MKQLCMLSVSARLALVVCLFRPHFGWAADSETEDDLKGEEARANQTHAEGVDSTVVASKLPSKPRSVASKFRRIVKRAAQKQRGKGNKSDSTTRAASKAVSSTKTSTSSAVDHKLGKKQSPDTGTVGVTAGSVALLFFTGAALKRHILGDATVSSLESHLPGALTENSIRLSESPTPEVYENTAAFSYSNQQSPRSILTQVAFPSEEALTPRIDSTPILVAGKEGSGPTWMGAGVAALLALFSVAGVFWANRETKRGGLLSRGLAAWDVDNCIMFVDVEGAHRLMYLEGEFLRSSARIYLDASQTTGVLRYLEKPRLLNNMVSRLIRRTLLRTELFPIPRDRCFAALSIVSPSVKDRSTTDRPIVTDNPEQEGKEQRKVVIKSAFVREVVDPKTGATAGILVHLERCPGWRRPRQQNYLLMRSRDFLGMLKPSEGLGGCPRIERTLDKSANGQKMDSGNAESSWTVATEVVETPFIDSIIVDPRLHILACNMKVMSTGTLRMYLLVVASGGASIKIHYALGSRQLLVSSRGPSSTDRAPCLSKVESGGLVFEENIPVYAAFPIKSLHNALDDVPHTEGDQLVAALKDLVLPFKTRTFGIVLEMRQESETLFPKKVALRKAGEVELRRGPESR